MNVFHKLAVLAISVVLCLAVGFVAGYNWCNSGKQAAVVDSLEIDAEGVAEVKEIVKIREKKVTVYVDRIKTVVDTTGCADMPVDPDIDDSLFQSYRLAKGPEADRRLPVHPVPVPSITEDAGSGVGGAVETGR